MHKKVNLFTFQQFWASIHHTVLYSSSFSWLQRKGGWSLQHYLIPYLAHHHWGCAFGRKSRTPEAENLLSCLDLSGEKVLDQLGSAPSLPLLVPFSIPKPQLSWCSGGSQTEPKTPSGAGGVVPVLAAWDQVELGKHGPTQPSAAVWEIQQEAQGQ